MGIEHLNFFLGVFVYRITSFYLYLRVYIYNSNVYLLHKKALCEKVLFWADM